MSRATDSPRNGGLGRFLEGRGELVPSVTAGRVVVRGMNTDECPGGKPCARGTRGATRDPAGSRRAGRTVGPGIGGGHGRPPHPGGPIRAYRRGWMPYGDDAYFSVRAWDVFSRDIPLLGTSSSGTGRVTRQAINHPGPLQFDLLAVPARLLGHDLPRPLLYSLAVSRLLTRSIAPGIVILAGWAAAGPRCASATANSCACTWPWQPSPPWRLRSRRWRSTCPPPTCPPRWRP